MTVSHTQTAGLTDNQPGNLTMYSDKLKLLECLASCLPFHSHSKSRSVTDIISVCVLSIDRVRITYLFEMKFTRCEACSGVFGRTIRVLDPPSGWTGGRSDPPVAITRKETIKEVLLRDEQRTDLGSRKVVEHANMWPLDRPRCFRNSHIPHRITHRRARRFPCIRSGHRSHRRTAKSAGLRDKWTTVLM